MVLQTLMDFQQKYRGIFKYMKFCKNGNGHISTPRASQNVSIETIDISRCDLAIFKHPDINNGSDSENEGSGPSMNFLYLNIPLYVIASGPEHVDPTLCTRSQDPLLVCIWLPSSAIGGLASWTRACGLDLVDLKII